MIAFDNAAVVADSATHSRTILQPTTLTLTEHRVALIGANGSGKSTLARLCNGLALPSSGSVRVAAPTGGADRAAAAAHPEWLDTVRDGAAIRRLVGFVFTNPATQLVMPTVIEDVMLSLRRTVRNARDRRDAALRALERFGLEGSAEQSVHALSGGQQQLLALASVLATEPRIVVADEPTTLLDLRNTRTITQTLLALPQQLIVATHHLDLAAACDRVLVIADGAVARDSVAAHEPPGSTVDWYRLHA